MRLVAAKFSVVVLNIVILKSEGKKKKGEFILYFLNVDSVSYEVYFHILSGCYSFT